MKKKIIVFLTIGLMLIINAQVMFVFGLSSTMSSDIDEINLEYFFDTPKIKKIDIGNKIYNKIILNDLPCSGNTGEPSLPVKGAYILLPQKTEVDNIIITPSTKKSLDLNYVLSPVGNFSHFLDENNLSLPIPKKEIYASSENFPGKLYDSSGVQSFRGYNILILSLYPLQYNPEKNRIDYYTSFEVNIKTKEKEDINPFFRGFEKDEEAVKDIVDNPDFTNSYINIQAESSDDTYDLLIVTKDSYKNEFQRLADERQDGIKTIIKTIDEIGFSNNLKPSNILNFLKINYWTLGIEYVLLGGDSDMIPVKYVKCYDPYYEELVNVATDQWYANLDLDLIPELHIGRVCADTVEEVKNFVDKTIDYINRNYDNYDQALMVGERLGSGIYGRSWLNQLIDQCTKPGYTTNGIPSDAYNIVKLYDADGTWTKEDLQNKINDEPSIINHVGHGNNFHVMKLNQPVEMKDGEIQGSSNDVIDYINNEQSFFIYSQACLSGAFDNKYVDDSDLSHDCIAEYLTVKVENGAFAGIFNTRFGWTSYNPNKYECPSQHFHRLFWSEMFAKTTLGFRKTIGEANTNSKINTINWPSSEPIHKYCYWEITLFGDPSVKLKGAVAPNKPDKPFGGNNFGYQYHSYDYYVFTEDLDGERVSYGLDWDGDNQVDEWTDLKESGIRIPVSHVWRDAGTYNFKVKAEDEGGFISEWSEPLVVTIEEDPNNPSPPDKPIVIAEKDGKRNEEYRFNISANEPDGDQVLYMCDFGDGKQSDWIGPYDSEEVVEIEHTWSKVGNYTVRVKAKDTYDAESEWTYFNLEIKSGGNYKAKNHLLNIIGLFLKNYPIVSWFLRQISLLTNKILI